MSVKINELKEGGLYTVTAGELEVVNIGEVVKSSEFKSWLKDEENTPFEDIADLISPCIKTKGDIKELVLQLEKLID